MSAQDWLGLLRDFGPAVLLLVIALVSGSRRVWVWGYQLQEAEARADKWERMALRGTGLAEGATDVARQLTDIAKQVQGGKG